MDKIGDMAAVMAEAAALDEDRELRLVRAVHQLHLENAGASGNIVRAIIYTLQYLIVRVHLFVALIVIRLDDKM